MVKSYLGLMIKVEQDGNLSNPFRRLCKIFGDRNVFSQAEQAEILKKYSKEDQERLFITKPFIKGR